ncbi:hypothetical protein P280DRAFT_392959 [Massarina eburnea CBS 473.64]|uniref:Uncharacterized protein n=1 Tax=Massarina eburnea CBS 473.64 TaxID=1395130 RepID=A0A6A6SCK9_9PLEO|nr:hypothetical protein P280DRAFT_392959 [Massarina eburnea CBS 473.64]
MSLYPSRPASRPTNYQSEDADQNVRPGGALQERRRYTPVEHGASDQLPSVLRSRSISHSNTQEGRSSWIPPDVVPGPAAQGYTEYAYRGQATRDQRREDYRGETPRAPAELDSRGRPVRRQSSNENTRPRAASTGFASRRDVSRGGPVPLGERPEFIIVGLFVLRLAKRVIERLDSYPERRADLAWIDSFLTYYRADDDLAELRGAAMDEFAKTNPAIISHFIKQPRYPIAFMEVDPTPRGREVRRLTDKEARDMVDFADAAAEWGSNVKLPGNERDRMEAIAAQRKIALYGS